MNEFINNLTSKQYLKLLDVAFGEVPADIKSLTDDEILEALGVQVVTFLTEIEELIEINTVHCDICGEYHDKDNVPMSCATGDGE